MKKVPRDGYYINRWHLCLIDRECWADWWDYGMPLRLHDHKRTRRHPHGWFITLLPGGWIQYLRGWRRVKDD